MDWQRRHATLGPLLQRLHWKDGSITTAVHNGDWFILEDDNAAHSDIISNILRLLKTRTIFIKNRSKSVPVHPNNRLLASRTVHPNGNSVRLFHEALASHFAVLATPPITDDAISTLFPTLTLLISPLLHASTPVTLNNTSFSLFRRIACLLPEDPPPPTPQRKSATSFSPPTDSVNLSTIPQRVDILSPPFPFTYTKHTLLRIDKLADAVANNEHVLFLNEAFTERHQSSSTSPESLPRSSLSTI